ncbi:hypothetical protein L596_016445 [Steinernema carpocapsae]|uniref:Uncharacterized protein n=1 Tax=Steinernema carpocapsae TaxID=34508 RepID=A0A4V6XW98_STECR|nr:hypothetical protein L596_016445 [Steinernema carpocapsae]
MRSPSCTQEKTSTEARGSASPQATAKRQSRNVKTKESSTKASASARDSGKAEHVKSRFVSTEVFIILSARHARATKDGPERTAILGCVTTSRPTILT